MARHFKDAIIDVLFSKSSVYCLRQNPFSMTSAGVIERVFSSTLCGSPLRRYILDACFTKLTPDQDLWERCQSQHRPSETSWGIWRRWVSKLFLSSKVSKPKIRCPWEKTASDYHESSGIEVLLALDFS